MSGFQGCRGAIPWRSNVTLALAMASIMLVAATGVGSQIASPLANISGDFHSTSSILSSLQVSSGPIASPGYFNGAFSYLNPIAATSNESPLTEFPCDLGKDPFTELSFTPSTNFGASQKQNLRVTFVFETTCGATPFAGTWTYGDGNTSTQGTPNGTVSSGPIVYRWWNYTHTYHYIGSFIAGMSITDGDGVKAAAGTNIYVSFVPSLFYSFYNESGLIGRGYTGTTYSIGLIEECINGVPNSQYQQDLNKFDSTFNLSSATITFVSANHNTCSNPTRDDQIEEDLDIEWAHVAAPGAKLYVCTDTLDSYYGELNCENLFYHNRNASLYNTMIVSSSYENCSIGDARAPLTNAPECQNGPDTYAANWSAAESAGMTILNSVGDWTQDGCLKAAYPASTPYVLAVGGTTVTGVGGGGTYGSEAAWYNSTPTPQCYLNIHQPENAFPPGETAGNNSYYRNGSWQPGTWGAGNRYFPDVSLEANFSTGVPIVYNGSWWIVGGTSLGAPVWAGILDVLFQFAPHGLSGFAVPFLYSRASCFHIILNHAGTQDGLGTPNVGCIAG